MPGGYRWMYQMTGLPGWARFGFSPGWGGMPPGAQFMMQSGMMPQFWSWMQRQMPYSPETMPMGPSMAMPGMSGDQEMKLLQNQARTLEGQLEEIRERIEELEEKEKGK